MQILISFVLFLSLSLSALAQEGRNTSKYNLNGGVGFKGYDPVSAFPEGGGAPKVGATQHSLIHSGVVYNFASAKNLERFRQDPEKYEPTYGGWCAFAMAHGSQIDINPKYVTINGRRAHYFVNARAKRNFDGDLESFEKRADGHWFEISGESPRR